LSLFLIFSWNAFGGSRSTNLLQKAITFFFSFPGSLEIFKGTHVVIALFINAIFWSMIFLIILYITNKLRN
jgi:hypothetical protein